MGACERKCVLGKWSRVSQRSLPLLKLRLGPGWALGLFRRGGRSSGRVRPGDAGIKWTAGSRPPSGFSLGGNWELNVMRPVGAVGLDVKLERGRKAQGCAGAHMLESQLCFVLLPIPHLFQRRKAAKFGPQVSSVVLKMYLWVLMGRAGGKKINALRFSLQ